MAAAAPVSTKFQQLKNFLDPTKGAVYTFFTNTWDPPESSRPLLGQTLIERFAAISSPLTKEDALYFLQPTVKGDLDSIPLITILKAFPHFRDLSKPENSPSSWPGESSGYIYDHAYYQTCFNQFNELLKSAVLPLLCAECKEHQTAIGTAYLEVLTTCAKINTFFARTKVLLDFFHYFLLGLPRLSLEQVKTPVTLDAEKPSISLLEWVHSLPRETASCFLSEKCPVETPLVVEYKVRNIITEEVKTLERLLFLTKKYPEILSNELEEQYTKLLRNPSLAALSAWNDGLEEKMRTDSPEKTGRIYLKFLGEPLSIDNFVVLHRYNREGLSASASGATGVYANAHPTGRRGWRGDETISPGDLPC